ncbi:histidine phosphotransferase family protein [Roseovarius rhodophyticola]|uniref:Histidine phosphotransferase family protein n=1 Tax=Roseovarius rhodophyticola TaxID=3080827 RepID=A0ABZ2TE35_9RHOB|nr:histidine phosphotransferase family protein [Roseovarius sp. W115]MDV2928244.1 histidine phosphotransferase family protein [Roseovarius sp. W115]
MSYNTNSLATMIGSRICHDLISPLGAVNNGLELMQLSNSTESPEMSLISQSVTYANARIRFFRLAFGMASEDQMTGAEEVNTILHDLQTDGRLKISDFPQGVHPRSQVRAILLAILCAEQAIPYGGQIAITEQNGTWNVIAQSDRLKPDPELWGLLNGTDLAQSLTPAAVQFAILPELLPGIGMACSTRLTPNYAEIRITPASHHPPSQDT